MSVLRPQQDLPQDALRQHSIVTISGYLQAAGPCLCCVEPGTAVNRVLAGIRFLEFVGRGLEYSARWRGRDQGFSCPPDCRSNFLSIRSPGEKDWVGMGTPGQERPRRAISLSRRTSALPRRLSEPLLEGCWTPVLHSQGLAQWTWLGDTWLLPQL